MRGIAGYLDRHRVGVASSVIVALAAALFTVNLLSAQGNEAREARLHDAGVWVSTNQTSGPRGTAASFGQINVPAEQLATVLTPPGTGSSLDVLQNGSAVLGYDEAEGTLTPINPSTQTLSRDDALSLGGRLPLLGGDSPAGTLAVLDRADGSLWAMTIDPQQPLGSLARVDSSASPTAMAGPGASAAVGVDGAVHAVSADGVTTVRPRPGAEWMTVGRALPDGLDGDLSITAVGAEPIVLARPASGPALLVLPDGALVEVDEPSAAGGISLQQPGPAAADVLLATDSALLAVSLGTGRVRTLFAAGTGKRAEPVFFQGCAFGAWAGDASQAAVACGPSLADEGAAQSKPLPAARASVDHAPRFRSNHGQLVLNDRATGEVWDDLDGAPRQIADWQAAAAPSQDQPDDPIDADGDDSVPAPVANDDVLGARPGRVTTLRVLDNDSTVEGTVLTVGSISAQTSAVGSVRVAPDRQSVLIELPADAARTYSFSYDVTNGNAVSEHPARVTVNVVAPDFHAAPQPRAGFAPSTWSVPANGVVAIPVLNDWRVYENGDPAALGPIGPAATTAPGASAVSSTDGAIVYSAGGDAGADTIEYTVLNGDQITRATLDIEVQSRADRPAAPIARDDFVRVVVGQPITVFPLANDLPGSDPLEPGATISVAGAIKGVAGLSVEPPDAHGGVELTASAVGDFILEYSAGYGSAPVSAPASIRVAAEAPNAHTSVATAPDSVIVRGLASTLIDPTANDDSPLGALLTVVAARAADGASLDVAVVRGKWLRVSQREPARAPRLETVTYTITDGNTSATGEVAVVGLPALENDVPVTVVDYATVRAGTQVIVSVLDNDVDPSGAGLTLVQDVDGAPAPGQLPVDGPGASGGGSGGEAFVSGNQVRYNAPATLAGESGSAGAQQMRVTYLAQNSQGQRVPGTLSITVTPALAPDQIEANQPPAPPDLEARVVAGGTVEIPVPTTGADPDGDPAQLLGLALPSNGDPQTKLGAIIGVSPKSFTYEAYPSPDIAGTDSFDYQVIDGYGRIGQATVRVAVVQPTVLPPPVAHNIMLTAAPGSTLRVQAISQAYVDYPDGAPPELTDPSLLVAEVRSIAALDDRNPGWLILTIPEGRTGESVAAVYEVRGDLGATSRAQITVRLDEAYTPPPSAVDQFATVASQDTRVSLNLLAGAYSRTGGSLSVRPQQGVTGDTLTVDLRDVPQVIPFVVLDSDGGTATALAYIPAGGSSASPSWNRDTLVIPAEGATARDIADYLVDPDCANLQLTDVRQVWSSPSTGLSARITGAGTLELTAIDGYQGPGSVTFSVSCTGDPNSFTLIAVPVVVGDPTPLLRCSTDVIDVQQALVGGAAVSPATLCHVWTPPGIEASSLTYHLGWVLDPGGVAIRGNDSARVSLVAGENSVAGATGTLAVTINGYGGAPGRLNVRIVPALSLRVAPIPVQTVLANGEPTRIDLSSYIVSPFGPAAVSIVRVSDVAQMSVSIEAGGRALAVSTTDPDARGTRTLGYTITDVGNPADSSRWLTGNLTLQIIGAPDAPTAVSPRPGFEPQSVLLSWVAPPANGAAIDAYEVSYSGSGSGTQACAAEQACVIENLANGGDYRFAVRAHNLIGWGPWSDESGVGTPDVIPGIVTGFAAGNPQDREVTLSWAPVIDESSSIDWSYAISWSGAVSGSAIIRDRAASSYTVTGLDNNSVTTFSITAANRAGAQQTPSRATGQSAGKPPPPAFSAQGIVATRTAAGQAAAEVSWSPVDANGPGPVVYTLTRVDEGGGNPVTVCAGVSGTRCTDAGLRANGRVSVYSVRAANQVFVGDPSPGVAVEVATPPEQMSAPVVRPVQAADPDDTVTLTFTTPASNGVALTVHCAYTSDGSTPTTGSAPCPTSPWSGYAPGGGQTDAKTMSGLAPGRSAPIRFILWADNGSSRDSQFRLGPASPASGSALTNAPPPMPAPAPNACGLNGDVVVYSWLPVTGTNGRSIDYVVDTGSGNASVRASETTIGVTRARSYTASHSVSVTARDSAGDTSLVLTIACPSATPPPPPPVGAMSCVVDQGSEVIIWTWTNPVVPAGIDTAYHWELSGALSGDWMQATASRVAQPGSGSHMLTVVTVDSGGQRSAPVSATCDAPDSARITLSRGAQADDDDCVIRSSRDDCYYLLVGFSGDVPPGPYGYILEVRADAIARSRRRSCPRAPPARGTGLCGYPSR